MISDITRLDVPLLGRGETLRGAIEWIIGADAPALPVIDERERLVGIFGEREFISAAFPGYLGQLKYAAFVPEELEDSLEKRRECLAEPVEKYMNTEHIDVPAHASETQVAETFLHHRVLIVPVVDEGRVIGMITRNDFFQAIARRVLEPS